MLQEVLQHRALALEFGTSRGALDELLLLGGDLVDQVLEKLLLVGRQVVLNLGAQLALERLAGLLQLPEADRQLGQHDLLVLHGGPVGLLVLDEQAEVHAQLFVCVVVLGPTHFQLLHLTQSASDLLVGLCEKKRKKRKRRKSVIR